MLKEAEASRYQKLGSEYPFLKVHTEALGEYSAQKVLEPGEYHKLLAYSLWMDYPDAVPGIAFMVGVNQKTAREYIDEVGERYEHDWIEVEEILERKRDEQDGKHPVAYSPLPEVTVGAGLSDDLRELQEHADYLKAEGYSSRAQVAEILFMRGFGPGLSQMDFSRVIGLSRERIRQICNDLGKDQFPLPSVLDKPRKKPIIGDEEGVRYSVVSRWLTAQYDMSPHLLSTYLQRLGNKHPDHFSQGPVNKPWKITGWGLHLLSKKIEESIPKEGFRKIDVTKLMEDFNISSFPIRRIRELRKKYPNDIRGGGRGHPWMITEKGAQLLNEVLEPLKPSADYSEYLVLPLARKLGLTRFRVRKTFDELAKLYPDDIKKGSGQRKGGKGKDWIVTQAGRQAIDKALEDYQAGKST